MKQQTNTEYSDLENRGQSMDKIINDFMDGNNQLIEKYYFRWRAKFIGALFKKCSWIGESELLSIYNESFQTVCLNIRNKKFRPSAASIETYLCSIGFKKLYTLIQKEQKYINISLTIPESYEIEDESNGIEIQKVVTNLMKNMGEPCKTILTDFYINQVKIKEIAQKIGYTEGGLKNKKMNCLQQAKEAIKLQL